MARLTQRLKEAVKNTPQSDRATTQAAEEFKVPEDPEKLVAWLEKKRKSGHKRMPDLQMKMNLAYTLGHQWIVWDRDRRQFRRPQWRPNDPNAPVRVTVNKVGALVERTVARLLKSEPQPSCRPVSDDEDDIGSAKVGTRILDHEIDRLHWHQKMIDLYFWVVILGFSYAHVYWDPSQGAKVTDDFVPDQDEDIPGALHATATTYDLFEGQVSVDMVPAFEMAIDPNALHFDEALWCVRTVSMTREACWEKFGIVPQTEQPGRTLVDEVYALTDKAREDRPYVETVPVHQFWMKPGGRSCPDGMVVTYAGQQVLEGPMDFPYDHGRLPFVQFDMLPGLGTREGRTWVTDLIPIQADYNDSRSREAAIRRVLTPKILAPAGSIDPQRITSRVEVITYAQTGQQPTLMMPDGRYMSQYEQNMNRANQELSDRAGQSDVSNGQAPAGTPAAAIMSLQEADDTKLAVSSKQVEAGVARAGHMMLQLVRQFWQEPRVCRTWSEEGDLEVFQFMGADVGEQMDVHVDSDSALPRSKSARIQLAQQLWQEQIITDPSLYMRLMDLPGMDFVADNINLDARQAQREHGKLIRGEDVAVNTFDNHMAHLTEHNNFRKSEDYEKSEVNIKAVIDAHCAVHEEMVMAQLQSPLPPGTPYMPDLLTPPGQDQKLSGTGTPPDGDEEAGEGVDNGPPNGPPGTPGNPAASGIMPAAQAAGIGGVGRPGPVPGVPMDVQNARMGM